MRQWIVESQHRHYRENRDAVGFQIGGLIRLVIQICSNQRRRPKILTLR